jgi:starvation-inducible DNA-binding protein
MMRSSKEIVMESTAPHVYIPPLGHRQHEEIGRELQATLVELIDLSLIGKQLHWSVSGPLFRPLHEQLDEFVDSWRDLADTVAERAVAIGSWPDGQASAVAEGSELGGLERGPVHDHRVVALLARRVAETAERVRTRMDRLGELDLASQDVLVEVVRALEQQQWMLRAQLPVDSAR